MTSPLSVLLIAGALALVIALLALVINILTMVGRL